jgi:hypothetical protein
VASAAESLVLNAVAVGKLPTVVPIGNVIVKLPSTVGGVDKSRASCNRRLQCFVPRSTVTLSVEQQVRPSASAFMNAGPTAGSLTIRFATLQLSTWTSTEVVIVPALGAAMVAVGIDMVVVVVVPTVVVVVIGATGSGGAGQYGLSGVTGENSGVNTCL